MNYAVQIRPESGGYRWRLFLLNADEPISLAYGWEKSRRNIRIVAQRAYRRAAGLPVWIKRGTHLETHPEQAYEVGMRGVAYNHSGYWHWSLYRQGKLLISGQCVDWKEAGRIVSSIWQNSPLPWEQLTVYAYSDEDSDESAL
jgi:hypothetical protein